MEDRVHEMVCNGRHPCALATLFRPYDYYLRLRRRSSTSRGRGRGGRLASTIPEGKNLREKKGGRHARRRGSRRRGAESCLRDSALLKTQVIDGRPPRATCSPTRTASEADSGEDRLETRSAAPHCCFAELAPSPRPAWTSSRRRQAVLGAPAARSVIMAAIVEKETGDPARRRAWPRSLHRNPVPSSRRTASRPSRRSATAALIPRTRGACKALGIRRGAPCCSAQARRRWTSLQHYRHPVCPWPISNPWAASIAAAMAPEGQRNTCTSLPRTSRSHVREVRLARPR